MRKARCTFLKGVDLQTPDDTKIHPDIGFETTIALNQSAHSRRRRVRGQNETGHRPVVTRGFPIVNLPELLNQLSRLSTPFIAVVALLHVLLFAFLWIWSRRDLRVIASSLDDFTRGLPHRSVLDRTAHVSDQIEAFLADVREILATPSRSQERALLLQRISILDEKRRYLHSLFFETMNNIARTMIESYPLMGVLGTILGIGAALQANSSGEAAASVRQIVASLCVRIWSTFAGLVAAVFLMLLNSMLEPRFVRLVEHRAHVREMISKAKRELALSGGESP